MNPSLETEKNHPSPSNLTQPDSNLKTELFRSPPRCNYRLFPSSRSPPCSAHPPVKITSRCPPVDPQATRSRRRGRRCPCPNPLMIRRSRPWEFQDKWGRPRLSIPMPMARPKERLDESQLTAPVPRSQDLMMKRMRTNRARRRSHLPFSCPTRNCENLASLLKIIRRGSRCGHPRRGPLPRVSSIRGLSRPTSLSLRFRKRMKLHMAFIASHLERASPQGVTLWPTNWKSVPPSRITVN